jgi:hypothetical protein
LAEPAGNLARLLGLLFEVSFAQLVRSPNVTTSISDPTAGWCPCNDFLVTGRASFSRALSCRFQVKDISPNAWQHVHLIGAFDFEQTESQIDIDALVARYDDPDFWNRALIEAPDDSLA